jgi:hypothetical protein
MMGTVVAAFEANPSEELVMIRTLARLALTAVIGGAIWSLRRAGADRADGDLKSKAKHPAVQTWEGEGGALPTTGSQMGPDPVSPVLPRTTETY